jgi:small-conductance mechanosensitive channel
VLRYFLHRYELGLLDMGRWLMTRKRGFSMRRCITLLLCLTLPLLTLPLCASAQDGAAVQPAGPIALAKGAAVDKAIERRIAEILAELDGYQKVGIAVNAGVVTLSGEALDSTALKRLDEIVSRVEGVVAVNDQVTQTTDVSERLLPSFERFKKRLRELVAFLPLLLVALIGFTAVLSIGLLLARLTALWNPLAPNPFIAEIYRQIVRLGFAVMGLVVALDILGATALLGSVLGAAGIIGLAIGFAVRDSVENFIASVMLSIRQPFRPFDLVEIEGDIGKVVSLTSRATILLSPEGNTIRIPNSTVFKGRIINYTHNKERQFQFDLGIEANADLAAARDLGIETLKQLPFVLTTPDCNGWIEDVGNTAVTLRFVAWIDQTQTSLPRARGEAIRLTKAAIEASGVRLPFPTYQVITEVADIARAERPAPALAPAPSVPTAVPIETIADVEPAEEKALGGCPT